MKITIALDVSEKPGFAVFHDNALVDSGTLFQQVSKSELGPYPYNYVKLATQVQERVWQDVVEKQFYLQPTPRTPICLVIEETTASSQNYSQKILEFLHLKLLERIEESRMDILVCYIRDGVWKRMTGANQNNTERNWNARISRYKKKHDKKIAKLVTEKGGKAHRVRRFNSKDYAIRAVKEIYGYELQKENEDEADAILLGTAFLWGAPVCDGTDEGGVLTDEVKEILLAKKCEVSRCSVSNPNTPLP